MQSDRKLPRAVRYHQSDKAVSGRTGSAEALGLFSLQENVQEASQRLVLGLPSVREPDDRHGPVLRASTHLKRAPLGSIGEAC